MKVKPKEVFVNLPIVLTFQDAEKIPEFCANVNTLLHGKVKMKYEELGALGGQFIGIFYLQRNDEFAELRADFKTLIEAEEIEKSTVKSEPEEEELEKIPNCNPKCRDYDYEGRCNRCGQFDCYECDWD